MNIVERVKKICVTPRTEWPVIAGETTPAASLITGYVLPLAAIGAAAGFIGGSLIGQNLPLFGTVRVPMATGIGIAVIALVMAIVGVFVLSLVINALAPAFGAERNGAQALKVAVYSYTPAWIAGLFQIVPALAILALVVALYGFYLLYLGLPRLMQCPAEKAVPYTAVVVVCAIVMTVVLTATGSMLLGTGPLGAATLSGAIGGRAPASELQALEQRLDESNRKMEAAIASGDEAAQMAAAMEGLGALTGGGGGVEPVDVEKLTALLPETFVGLRRTGRSAETSLGSSVKATYGDGTGKVVTLDIMDTGGLSGLLALGSLMALEGQKEDEDGFERTRKVGNRMIHESMSKSEGTSEVSITLGDRFIVTASGSGVDLDDLKAAVSRLDLDNLESMK